MIPYIAGDKTMGKLVPFKRPEKPRNNDYRSNSLQGLGDPSFLASLTSELKLAGIDIDPTFRIITHLNSLRGHILNETIAIRRQGLKNYSLEELREIAQNSNENDWTNKPAFYRALVDEINARQ